MNLLRELFAILDAFRATPACPPRLRALLAVLLAALARYDAEAPSGLTLDAAMGLTRKTGPAQWWRQEQKANRDRLLREIVAKHYPEANPTAAARAILRDKALLGRQRDPVPGSATAELARAARHAEIPGTERQLRDILTEIN